METAPQRTAWLLTFALVAGCSAFFDASTPTSPDEAPDDAGGAEVDVEAEIDGEDVSNQAATQSSDAGLGDARLDDGCRVPWTADVSGCELWRLLPDPSRQRVHALGKCVDAEGTGWATVVTLEACTGAETRRVQIAQGAILRGGLVEDGALHVVGSVRTDSLDHPLYARLTLDELAQEPIETRRSRDDNGGYMDLVRDDQGNLVVTGFFGTWGGASRTFLLDSLDDEGEPRCGTTPTLPPLSVGNRMLRIRGGVKIAGLHERQAVVWSPVLTCEAESCRCELTEVIRVPSSTSHASFEPQDFLAADDWVVVLGGGTPPQGIMQPSIGRLQPGGEPRWAVRSDHAFGAYRAGLLTNQGLVAAGVLDAANGLAGDWGDGVLTTFDATTLTLRSELQIGPGVVTDLCAMDEDVVISLMNRTEGMIRRCSGGIDCGR